ncbi:lysophospholipid acyltransferase family protein [Tepidicaulis sp. LMO-SS28]|uniref:lysophospholipid acyltransferase family protein n=1 Tax=Tepidicaulis sp. LMO-SS28 TaxID=3447455 RepID=UPI003EDEB0C7
MNETTAKRVGKLLGTLRASILLTGFIGSALLLMPLQWVCVKLGLPASKSIPLYFHRWLCRLIGIRVHVKGALYDDGPCLMASNHVSWLDIPVLSSAMACSFVAKKEVGAWPFFGTLARLQQTVFVERDRRAKVGEQRNEIYARVAGGDRLVLFPEGTSGDGNRVLPFKSALMSVAEMGLGDETESQPVVVQPVSIAYTKLSGLPMTRRFRPFFAWYGDMELFPHLWEAFSLGPIDVVVAFHEPVTLTERGNRKQLAAYCGACSAEGLVRAVMGREEIPVEGLKPAFFGAGEPERLAAE